jgi:hypothetical protein
MASRATSSAADGVALSTPVTYWTTLLRPEKRGFPIYRRIFARHLPGSRSNARTTKCLYSMRAPPEIATVSEYATGVSESFRETGENVELSWALLPVGTYNQALRSFIRAAACSAGSSRHRTSARRLF